MSDKRTAGARPQRGRTPQAKRRGNSVGILIAIVAIVAVVGVAVIGIASQSGKGSTAQTGGIASTIPLDSLPSRGSASAPVTVIEFGDFQCPACGAFATTLEPAIVKDYIDTGKVRFVFHDFPLSQHKNAVPAAEAARCANDQGAFWPFHDLLYARQQEWSDSPQPNMLFASYFAQLKLDGNAFAQCVSSGKHRAEIQQAYQDSIKAGINSTPTFVIDGKPYDATQLRGAIDAALAKK